MAMAAACRAGATAVLSDPDTKFSSTSVLLKVPGIEPGTKA